MDLLLDLIYVLFYVLLAVVAVLFLALSGAGLVKVAQAAICPVRIGRGRHHTSTWRIRSAKPAVPAPAAVPELAAEPQPLPPLPLPSGVKIVPMVPMRMREQPPTGSELDSPVARLYIPTHIQSGPAWRRSPYPASA